MAVTKEEVQRIASLAKLSFSDEEIETLRGELQVILSYIEKINSVTTGGVEPLTTPVPLQPVLREDIIGVSLSSEKALQNTPDSDPPFFTVPKVIQGS